VGWYLEYFDSVGLATRHGLELGEAALDEGAGRVVARQDDAVDAVVARGLGARVPLDAVSMVVVGSSSICSASTSRRWAP